MPTEQDVKFSDYIDSLNQTTDQGNTNIVAKEKTTGDVVKVDGNGVASKPVVSNNVDVNRFFKQLLLPKEFDVSAITGVFVYKKTLPGSNYWVGIRFSFSGVYKDFIGYFNKDTASTEADAFIRENFVMRNADGFTLSAIVDWSVPTEGVTWQRSVSFTADCQDISKMTAAYMNLNDFLLNRGELIVQNVSRILDNVPWLFGNYSTSGVLTSFPQRLSTEMIELPKDVVSIKFAARSLAHNYAVVCKVFDAEKKQIATSDWVNIGTGAAEVVVAKPAKYVAFTAHRNASDNILADESDLIHIDLNFTISVYEGRHNITDKIDVVPAQKSANASGVGSYFGQPISLGGKKSYNVIASKSYTSGVTGFEDDMKLVQSCLAYGAYLFVFGTSSKVYVVNKFDLSIAGKLTLPTTMNSHCNVASWLPWAYESGDLFPMFVISDGTTSATAEVFRLSGTTPASMAITKIGSVSCDCRTGFTPYACTFICDRSSSKMIVRTPCDKSETIFDPLITLSRVSSSQYSKFHIYPMPSRDEFLQNVTSMGYVFSSQNLLNTFYGRYATGQDADAEYGLIYQQMDYTSADDRLCSQEGIWVYNECSGCEVACIEKYIPVDDVSDWGESEGVSIDGNVMYWVQHNYDYSGLNRPVMKIQAIVF